MLLYFWSTTCTPTTILCTDYIIALEVCHKPILGASFPKGMGDDRALRVTQFPIANTNVSSCFER